MLLKKGLLNCIVYDIEIANEVKDIPGGWGNPYAMGISSAVTYDFSNQRYGFFFEEEDRSRLIESLDGRIVVGFNSIKFDNRVLLGNEVVHLVDMTDMGMVTKHCDHTGKVIASYRNYDILVEYIRGRWGFSDPVNAVKKLSQKGIHDGTFSLDAIAGSTLGLTKTGSGVHAPILYQQGKIKELFEYNLNDVRITKELFLFIQSYGYMIDGAGRKVYVLR